MEWLDLSALDNIGKRLCWDDMIGSRFIWLGGRRLKDNQDYLVEEPSWISPPAPNHCVVIRRLVALITDY